MSNTPQTYERTPLYVDAMFFDGSKKGAKAISKWLDTLGYECSYRDSTPGTYFVYAYRRLDPYDCVFFHRNHWVVSHTSGPSMGKAFELTDRSFKRTYQLPVAR